MLYITGDTHGDQEEWAQYIDPFLKPDDTLVIAGDFGVGFWDGRMWAEETFYDWLETRPYTVLFVDGNHENFDKLYSCPVSEWNGGRVHKLRSNVIHLMRGEIFRIEGRTIFVFGGGYSIDKPLRKEGFSWWPQELPSAEEYENAERNLARFDFRVDHIITHTAPQETLYYLTHMRSFGIRGDIPEDRELTTFLDTVRQRTAYTSWYFGHYHIDAEIWRGQTALLHAVRELASGKIVHWKQPRSDIEQ